MPITKEEKLIEIQHHITWIRDQQTILPLNFSNSIELLNQEQKLIRRVDVLLAIRDDINDINDIQSTKPLKVYEYKKTNSIAQGDLNTLGDEGWSFVSVLPSSVGNSYLFTRIKQPKEKSKPFPGYYENSK